MISQKGGIARQPMLCNAGQLYWNYETLYDIIGPAVINLISPHYQYLYCRGIRLWKDYYRCVFDNLTFIQPKTLNWNRNRTFKNWCLWYTKNIIFYSYLISFKQKNPINIILHLSIRCECCFLACTVFQKADTRTREGALVTTVIMWITFTPGAASIRYMRLFITKLIVKLVLISLLIMSCLCAPINIKKDNMQHLQNTGWDTCNDYVAYWGYICKSF